MSLNHVLFFITALRYLAYYFPLFDDVSDNCCVSVMPAGDKLVTMIESHCSLVIDHLSLKTVDKVFFVINGIFN